MKIPVEKSIYRKVYLQLKTGFLPERPVFYDAVRQIPPPVFSNVTGKLPNLDGLEDRLIKNFKRIYPYQFEDFASDHPESTQYVAYRFASQQAALMKKGMSEKEAFAIVEKKYLEEASRINSELSKKVDLSGDNAGKENLSNQLYGTLNAELEYKRKMRMSSIVDKTIDRLEKERGLHVIEEKLKDLEYYSTKNPTTKSTTTDSERDVASSTKQVLFE